MLTNAPKDTVLICRTLALIILYYTFSICLTFYNKWLFKGFHFPLSISLVHILVKFGITAFIREYNRLVYDQRTVWLSWQTYIRRVSPTAISTALDIGLSNWSFLFITVSLYTMSKSTCIIFILGFSIWFRLEEFKASQISVVALISGGLLLFTYQSTDFNLFGFILVLSASFIGGLRWALAQTILQKESVGLANPIDLMFHLQPIMAITLLPLAVFIEGPSLALSSQVFRAANLGDALWTLFLILIGSILGFLLSLSEYFVVLQTSSLTLSISGIFKEICTLSIAFTLGGDKINLMNFIGLVVCLAGITLHVYMKAQIVLKKNSAKDHNYQRIETI